MKEEDRKELIDAMPGPLLLMLRLFKIVNKDEGIKKDVELQNKMKDLKEGIAKAITPLLDMSVTNTIGYVYELSNEQMEMISKKHTEEIIKEAESISSISQMKGDH
jgi:hypothetical protein